MAINPTTAFPGKIAPADASYPYGKARNITAPGDGTGTPLNATLLNDVWGFFQHLLRRAGIQPSGTPDTAPVSQYGDGVRNLAAFRLGNFALNRWTQRTPASNSNWVMVDWSSNVSVFAAVSNDGFAMSSPDGVTWTTRAIAASQWLSVYRSDAVGLFVAFGNNASCSTSPDGITWTTRALPGDPASDYTYTTHSPELGLFVTVGASPTGSTVLTSPNGITWTVQTVPVLTESTIYGVTWAASLGLFVGITITKGQIVTSPDGITWTAGTILLPGGGGGGMRVEWSNEQGIFVASGFGLSNVWTSPDGITWTSRSLPIAGGRSVRWIKEWSLFANVGGNVVLTSPDGINWTSSRTGVSSPWLHLAWSKDLLRAVAVAGVAPYIQTSL